VGVSNSSCTGTTCSGVTCGRINYAAADDWRMDRKPRHVACNGVVGTYVWIQLPGSRRILPPTPITVNTYVPPAANLYTPANQTFICYGVAARDQTTTTPQYSVVTDPEDPVFYSTCFVRAPNVTWLDSTPPPPDDQWRYGSGDCLACDSVAAEFNDFSDTLLETPSWTIQANTDQCVDCQREPEPKASWYTFKPLTNILNGTYFNTGMKNCSASVPTDPTSCDMTVRLPQASNTPTIEECAFLVQNTPACQPDIFAFHSYWKTCQCWRSDACCGQPNIYDCTAQSWCTPYTIYINRNTPPDPTCLTGLISGDGRFCCATTCRDSNGNPDCNTPQSGWNVRYPYGQCTNANVVRTCNTTGPPCNM
jgi:hypothetical protein